MHSSGLGTENSLKESGKLLDCFGRTAEGAYLPTLDPFRYRIGIATRQIDVLVNQGRQPGHIFREHGKAFCAELLECRIDFFPTRGKGITPPPKGSALVAVEIALEMSWAKDGHPVTPELAAATSPYMREQIRRFDRFTLNMEDLPAPLNPQPLPFETPL